MVVPALPGAGIGALVLDRVDVDDERPGAGRVTHPRREILEPREGSLRAFRVRKTTAHRFRSASFWMRPSGPSLTFHRPSQSTTTSPMDPDRTSHSAAVRESGSPPTRMTATAERSTPRSTKIGGKNMDCVPATQATGSFWPWASAMISATKLRAPDGASSETSARTPTRLSNRHDPPPVAVFRCAARNTGNVRQGPASRACNGHDRNRVTSVKQFVKLNWNAQIGPAGGLTSTPHATTFRTSWYE